MKTYRMTQGLSLFSLLATLGFASPSAAAPSMAGASPKYEVFVSEAVAPLVSPALRDLPPARHDKVKPQFVFPRRTHPSLGLGILDLGIEDDIDFPPLSLSTDTTRALVQRTPSPLLVFDGIPFTGFHPPDPVGDVGPNHYVQANNTEIAIWDKNGTQIVAPHQMGDIWSSLGGTCASNGGDPVVLYDQVADRWFLSQLGATGSNVCIAVSKTADPGGQYNVYRFNVPNLPDYLKFGVWPDAYYMGSNENSYTAYAFDRAKILAGQPATFQRFAGETNLLLPADLDGPTLPPAGSPGLFYTFKDDIEHGGQDRLEVFELHVDWTTPGNSTFQMVNSIPISPFIYTVCGAFTFACITQKNTNQKLDAISEWPMFRLQYRNFGTYQTLIGNFTTDVDNTNHAGIRWFELRKTMTAWALQQEGTHAPDANNRWIGSIAMDRVGNIALGYSVASSTTFPEIRYATRLATDMPGTLQTEVTMKAGNGSQTGIDRWGDYTSMSVDPVDDCTFFYTNEYMVAQGQTWATSIGKFRIPGCGKDNGATCSAAVDCKSGFCADGVCCATDCGADPNDCQACSTAAGGTINGTCSPRSAGTTCRNAAGPCDSAETCDGTAAACPMDQFLNAMTVCRPSAAPCDAPEMCSGNNAACPADALAAAGTVCRDATGACDTAETCNGASSACPADQFSSAMTVCRVAAGACDTPEMCSGSSVSCPADAIIAAGTVCRDAAGACDAAESCDGASTACPADALAVAGTVCRDAAGACDAAESCDGASTACPADLFLDSKTVCRDAAGTCDAPEMCSGSKAECPADVVASAGTVCRAATNSCDADEVCDGTANMCPSDVLMKDGSTCDNGGTCSAGLCKAGSTADPTDTGSCGCRIPGSDSGDNRGAFVVLGLLAMAHRLRRRTL